MHGNAEEYTLDAYTEGDDYLATFGANYQPGDTVVEPRNATPGTGFAERLRVMRGGHRNSDVVSRLCSARRKTANQSSFYLSATAGFRVVCPIQF